MKNILMFIQRNFLKVKRFNYSQYIKTNILFFSTTISLLINSTIIRSITVKNIFDIRPFISDLCIILFILSFAYLLKPKKQIVYFMTVSIIFTAICVINSIYFTYYASFASVSLISVSMQVVDVADAVTESVVETKDFIYLWQPLLILFLHYNLKSHNYYFRVEKIEKGKERLLGTITASIIMGLILIVTISSVAISRLEKQWNREYLVMQFGINIYQINDLIRSLEPSINAFFGYDKAALKIKTYYAENKKEPVINEYTNIFKDKNILAIHFESAQQFLMDLKFNDLEVTPNLNRLAKEGIFFSNFYSQVGIGTSSDTEFTFNTSLMPSTTGTVFVSYWNREFITIPKLLKEQGYYTFSMHGNKADMWNRKLMHKEMGYDRFYSENDYEIDEVIGLGLADKSFFRQSIDKIEKISNKYDKYYGTLITLSNHTPFSNLDKYGDYDVDMKVNKLNPVTGLEEPYSYPYMEDTIMGRYIKSMHYSDEALGEFINGLDEKGLLEDTVIVIYGDHDARLSKKDFQKLYNYNYETNNIKEKLDPSYIPFDYYEYELNRDVPLVIWTKEKNFNKDVKEVMGMIDVFPTLGNMFNFNSPYQLGNDIFSVKDNVVGFTNGNWLTNDVYYNSQKQEFKLLNSDATISQEYIDKYINDSENKIDISNDIIKYDFIRKIKETENILNNYNK